MNIRTFTYAVENYLAQYRQGRITLDEAEGSIKAEIVDHLETMEADYTRWLKDNRAGLYRAPDDVLEWMKADPEGARHAHAFADRVQTELKGEALLRFKGFFRGIDGTY